LSDHAEGTRRLMRSTPTASKRYVVGSMDFGRKHFSRSKKLPSDKRQRKETTMTGRSTSRGIDRSSWNIGVSINTAHVVMRCAQSSTECGSVDRWIYNQITECHPHLCRLSWKWRRAFFR
jgi:hypothetical protein